MQQNAGTLSERRNKLSFYAQVIRNQAHTSPGDMMLLAKILSRQALLELEMQTLGADFAHSELQTKPTDDECPF